MSASTRRSIGNRWAGTPRRTLGVPSSSMRKPMFLAIRRTFPVALYDIVVVILVVIGELEDDWLRARECAVG